MNKEDMSNKFKDAKDPFGWFCLRNVVDRF